MESLCSRAFDIKGGFSQFILVMFHPISLQFIAKWSDHLYGLFMDHLKILTSYFN